MTGSPGLPSAPAGASADRLVHITSQMGVALRRLLLAPLLAAALVLGAFVAPVGAITGGQPDGDGHPQVALLLVPNVTFCSGTLIAASTILTAGHCTDFWDELVADEELDWDGTVLVSFGRITSLNHRTDLPEVHAWITGNTQ